MSQLIDITECCICLKTFTDPRMLPCIHTFCVQCIQDMADKTDKKTGDALPCPVCRKEFPIPSDGIQGLQRNFFMTSLIEVRNALNQSTMDALSCDICKTNTEAVTAKIPEAKARCLVCKQNLCECCLKLHKTFTSMKNHEILKRGETMEVEEVVKNLQTMNCDIHRGRVSDYYCTECKKVVCVSCFVESHRTHDCKDVYTVEEEFRQIIKRSATSISNHSVELLAKKNKSETKEKFLQKMLAREKEILKRSEELKKMIDKETKSLLSSLEEIKNRHLKEIQIEEDELERRLTILESFSRYCDELRRKGSASDVCRSKDELLRRADELEEDHETYIMRPNVSFDVTFQATDLDNILKTTKENIVGGLKVYDRGIVFDPSILDVTDGDIIARFLEGVSNIASLSFAIGYPTLVSVPHLNADRFKNLLASATATDIEPKEAEIEFLKDPSTFGKAAADAAPAAAAKLEQKEVKYEEEEDDDMDFGQAKPQARSDGALRPSLMKGGDQFIAGGTDAAPGEFPWQLSVQRQSVTWSHSFGASLLSANYALTAAHGVDGSSVNGVRVVAGLHQQSDVTGAQIVSISSYQMHESYGVGAGTFANDIAILTFATPVIISGTTQPATLPVDDSNSYDGYICVITGWGSTGLSEPDALQKASIQVLSTIECSSFMDSVPGSRVTDSQICVYDPAHIVGVCGGDTGGPLNCPDGATLVVGVGSWIMTDGGDNCQQQSPSVYTRVSSYLGWIAANTP